MHLVGSNQLLLPRKQQMRKVLYLLGVLDDRDIEWLAQNGTRQHASAGTELITENQPIESLYIVLDGELSVCVQSTRMEIARLRAGEIVGELSLVDTQPSSASVISVTDSWLLSIPRELLSLRLSKDVAFAARFYHSIAMFLSERLRTTVSRLGYGDVRQDSSADELVDASLDSVSLAALRFDKMLHKLRGEYKP